MRLFPRNRGGLVNEYLSFLARLRFFLFLFLFYFILFISIFFYNHRMCKVAQGVFDVIQQGFRISSQLLSSFNEVSFLCFIGPKPKLNRENKSFLEKSSSLGSVEDRMTHHKVKNFF